MKKETDHQLSYVFNKSEKAIYLKSSIKKNVETPHTYERTQVNSSKVNFQVSYKKKPLTGSANMYNDQLLIKLSIKVPDQKEYTVKFIRSLISEYLKKFGNGTEFKVKAFFKQPDESAETHVITSISENADIDLTN